MAFSPDGRELAAVGCCEPDSAVKVWDARQGRSYSVRTSTAMPVHRVLADGRLLAAGTEDGKVVLWDARHGSKLGAPIQVATGTIDPISFSPDGRLFAASSGDQTVTLWDVRTRKRLANPFPVEQGSVPVAQFAPNGDLVILNLGDTMQWPTDVQRGSASRAGSPAATSHGPNGAISCRTGPTSTSARSSGQPDLNTVAAGQRRRTTDVSAFTSTPRRSTGAEPLSARPRRPAQPRPRA